MLNLRKNLKPLELYDKLYLYCYPIKLEPLITFWQQGQSQFTGRGSKGDKDLCQNW